MNSAQNYNGIKSSKNKEVFIGVSIFIVESNFQLKTQLSDYLANASYKPVGAKDGAVAELKIRDRSFDFIVIGLSTSKVDGIHIIKSLRGPTVQIFQSF